MNLLPSGSLEAARALVPIRVLCTRGPIRHTRVFMVCISLRGPMCRETSFGRAERSEFRTDQWYFFPLHGSMGMMSPWSACPRAPIAPSSAQNQTYARGPLPYPYMSLSLFAQLTFTARTFGIMDHLSVFPRYAYGSRINLIYARAPLLPHHYPHIFLCVDRLVLLTQCGTFWFYRLLVHISARYQRAD